MRRRIDWLAALLALLLAAPSALAQPNNPRYVRAIAAGYKAGFLCSNIFNGGLTEAQTEHDDLRGTYAELNPIFPTLPAEIDHGGRRVSVGFAEDMPPRIAVWRPYLGCTQLPIGATMAASEGLPRLLPATPDPAALDRRPWPMGDRNAVARPRGDAAALGRAVAEAFDRSSFGAGSETTAVVVVQNGRIVAERYRPDFDMHNAQRTWSVAKSIAATVIGAAVHRGMVDLAAPLAMPDPRGVIAARAAGGEVPPRPAIPEWSNFADPRGAITIDHLLRMASGLNSDFAGNRTDALYFGGVGISEQAAAFPLIHRPGTVFRYANNDTVLATRALQYALGDGGEALLFPYRELFWRIGMTRTFAETDWNGHFIMSSQLWTTARDLARLGLLHLDDGMWNGERILPEGWTDYVRRHGPAQPAAGYGYGASWWTFPAEAGLPADAIVARGNRGQFVVVIPSRQVVIVRRGFDGTGIAFDLDGFTARILAALS